MAQHNQFTLLFKRQFAPYFLAQFLGAFNDNVYKNSLLILITFQVVGLTQGEVDFLVNLSAGLFILPFFLFSATAGQFADKYEKSFLIRRIKFLEIIIMGLAVLGFFLGNVSWLIGVLFLTGTQAAFFGPIKYSILPQHLNTEELIGGNALVETGTFLAILLGTILGGILIGVEDYGIFLVSVTVFTLAVLGYWSSCFIPTASPAAPTLRINWNLFTEIGNNLKSIHGNHTLFLSILGISWFWLFGMMYLTQLSNYTKIDLGGNAQVVTVLLTLFSLGIGLGSLLCEKLSGHRVELGLVPFGSIGMTLFGLDLVLATPTPTHSELIGASEFLQQPGSWRIMLDIVLISAFGGLYIVPLYSLIQQRSERSHVSRVIASNNIINALFMVLSAIVAALLLDAGLTIPQVFLVATLMNAAVAVYIFTLVPEFLMRFLIWLLINTIYRVETQNLEKIPEEGATILVCNHISYVDALVIAGCSRRPVRFVIHYKIYQLPVLNFVFRTGKTIPIAGAKEDAQLLEQAFQQIAAALVAGDLLCVFPEGKISNDGEMNPFRTGIEKIIATNPVPVIPMALCGLWGTFFSRYGGPAMLKIPRRLWSKIALKVGEPLAPTEVTAQHLQEKVLELRGNWK